MGSDQSISEHSPDKVTLYQFNRGPHVPSPSPFCLKLETYLRLAKIDYQNELSSQRSSSKGKLPWIMCKGKAVEDSQLCIEHLNEEFNVDLNKNLTEEQRAVSRAFLKMTEENLFWFFVLYRWHYGDRAWLKNYLFANAPALMKICMPIIARRMDNAAWGHGIGRHSYDELVDIMKKDMNALSGYLGDKDFFMGSEPTEIDCAVFGQLANVKWSSQEANPQTKYMLEHCENLSKHCDRMKERAWPDWNENIACPPNKSGSK